MIKCRFYICCPFHHDKDFTARGLTFYVCTVFKEHAADYCCPTQQKLLNIVLSCRAGLWTTFNLFIRIVSASLHVLVSHFGVDQLHNDAKKIKQEKIPSAEATYSFLI